VCINPICKSNITTFTFRSTSKWKGDLSLTWKGLLDYGVIDTSQILLPSSSVSTSPKHCYQPTGLNVLVTQKTIIWTSNSLKPHISHTDSYWTYGRKVVPCTAIEGRLPWQHNLCSVINKMTLTATPIARIARMNFTGVMVTAGWTFGTESLNVRANVLCLLNKHTIPKRVMLWSLEIEHYYVSIWRVVLIDLFQT
jgi:hypothetical protein